LARVGWLLLAGASVALFFISLPSYYTQVQVVCADLSCAEDSARLTPASVQTLNRFGISMRSYALYMLGISIVLALVYWAVGAVIFWHRSTDRMALLAALSLVLAGSSSTVNGLGALPGWWLPVAAIDFLVFTSLVLAFYLFPNGRFVPFWTRWLAAIFVLNEFFYDFFPDAPFSPRNAAPVLEAIIWFGSFVGIAVAQVYRYWRVSNVVERQQTKWVVFGLAIAIASLVGFLFPPLVFPSLKDSPYYQLAGIPVITASLILLPLSIGLAILRSHLWDIDLLIRRTLVYSVLTAILALVYFSSVVLLQSIFSTAGGQRSAAVIIFSTLAIAALFTPLHRRVQDSIDRRFYRKKYDAAQVLAAFSATLREEVDLEHLTNSILEVAEDTMQPAHVSLWLCEVALQPRKRQVEANSTPILS
jgi:hypothetical protein